MKTNVVTFLIETYQFSLRSARDVSLFFSSTQRHFHRAQNLISAAMHSKKFRTDFLVILLIGSQKHFAIAQNNPNTLPSGGKVVAGSATISQTSNATSATMNVNQTSQRAVINWDSFNVGSNAQVNFNQPNSSAVILNRVSTGASPSVIDGALRANGQVVLVNPNGVTFGKGAQINAAGVVATTMDMANRDFMEGKSTCAGNGKGKVHNKGTISTNDPNGYIALLAPEVRNEGYLLAQKGANNTIAMAAGEQITLDFRGDRLIGCPWISPPTTP